MSPLQQLYYLFYTSQGNWGRVLYWGEQLLLKIYEVKQIVSPMARTELDTLQKQVVKRITEAKVKVNRLKT